MKLFKFTMLFLPFTLQGCISALAAHPKNNSWFAEFISYDGTAIGFIAIVIGILLIFKMQSNIEERRKYEFENTNQHGVVEFDNYDDARKHRKAINGTDISGAGGGFGIFLCGLGFLILLFAA